MPNGANTVTNMSSGGQGSNFLPNNNRVIQSGGTRILCVADVRGKYVQSDESVIAAADFLRYPQAT